MGEWVRGEEKVPYSRQAQIRIFLEVMPATPLFDVHRYALKEES